ncbi:hypothetical protein OIU74_028574 [Salix koriyanagi]|uniref:Uncharacterized protein n=1 Tax=Salix koriyanagi TaxID=2511006 RepID=A0A9Q0ZT58_9ROSI|nr:hypothetical protein OIU74_028574 [Salix koriyanagi]
MITIVKPIPYLYTTCATEIMPSQPLQDINFNHCSFTILVYGADNFDCHSFFLFIIKTFQDLPKSSFTHLAKNRSQILSNGKNIMSIFIIRSPRR